MHLLPLYLNELVLLYIGNSGERLKIPIEKGWNIFDLKELEVYISKLQEQWDRDEAEGKHAELRAKGERVPGRPVFRGRWNNYAYDDPKFQAWLQRGITTA